MQTFRIHSRCPLSVWCALRLVFEAECVWYMGAVQEGHTRFRLQDMRCSCTVYITISPRMSEVCESYRLYDFANTDNSSDDAWRCGAGISTLYGVICMYGLLTLDKTIVSTVVSVSQPRQGQRYAEPLRCESCRLNLAPIDK